MKQKFTVDVNVWRILYYKYKPFVVPVSIIVVCLLILLVYVIPNIQNWSSIQDQITTDKSQIQILSQNLSTLSSTNSQQLSQSVNLATQALPTTKDFSSIFLAVASASAKSNIALGDYGIEVGDLSNKESASSLPLTMPISLSIKGSIDDLFNFTNALKSELPLSDITEITVSGNSAISLTIVFYYVPYQSHKVDMTQPIQGLSTSELDVLQHLGSSEGIIVISPSTTPTPTPVPTIINFPTGPEQVNLGTNSAGASGSAGQ